MFSNSYGDRVIVKVRGYFTLVKKLLWIAVAIPFISRRRKIIKKKKKRKRKRDPKSTQDKCLTGRKIFLDRRKKIILKYRREIQGKKKSRRIQNFDSLYGRELSSSQLWKIARAIERREKRRCCFGDGRCWLKRRKQKKKNVGKESLCYPDGIRSSSQLCDYKDNSSGTSFKGCLFGWLPRRWISGIPASTLALVLATVLAAVRGELRDLWDPAGEHRLHTHNHPLPSEQSPSLSFLFYLFFFFFFFLIS